MPIVVIVSGCKHIKLINAVVPFYQKIRSLFEIIIKMNTCCVPHFGDPIIIADGSFLYLPIDDPKLLKYVETIVLITIHLVRVQLQVSIQFGHPNAHFRRR